ncbi:alpha/beta fold hydrolase [Methylopila sp. 73B]|uniref:alpha/beta fold hydrolase n=1 Tax=Methylopila sp. 73B TaxID=1120792 RepID=UPI0003A988E7|nr:alpha/beta fold hydrolase [Methylopila sp. 73B]
MEATLPIVFAPGLGCTERLFAPQVADLGARPFMTIDHRRHATLAEIAAAALAEAPERFALVGLSMGGYVAFEMLKAAPERIVRLALLDTTAYPDTEEGRGRRRVLIAAAERGKLNSIHAATYARYVHPARVNEPELERVVRAMLIETGAPAFARQMTAILNREDFSELPPTIACPTLVLVGDHDAPTPPEHARRMAAAIPGAELVIVPNCGHLSTLERPEAVNAALARLLAR